MYVGVSLGLGSFAFGSGFYSPLKCKEGIWLSGLSDAPIFLKLRGVVQILVELLTKPNQEDP